jgi:hypothetical protein
MKRSQILLAFISIAVFFYLIFFGTAHAAIEASDLAPIASSIAADLGVILIFALALLAFVVGATVSIKLLKKMTTLST